MNRRQPRSTRTATLFPYPTLFLSSRGGAIVSIVAPVERGFPMFAHSGAARAGVMNLTRTLASEWAADGVRVNAIAPGIIWSGGLEQYPREHLRLLAERLAASPAGRFGTESEIAAEIGRAHV